MSFNSINCLYFCHSKSFERREKIDKDVFGDIENIYGRRFRPDKFFYADIGLKNWFLAKIIETRRWVWDIFCNFMTIYHSKKGSYNMYLWRCPWCNCYRRRKWTRRHEFKSWTRLIAFPIAPLGKVWIQLFSLQLWVNSRTDWLLQPWWSN